MTHIPNNYEIDLMLSLVKRIDDYNELKEIAFIQYCFIRSIMGNIEAFILPMPVEFIFELKEILNKCDDFEPEWRKSYEALRVNYAIQGHQQNRSGQEVRAMGTEQEMWHG